MPMTIDEIYTQLILILPPTDRLRLATLILNNLVEQNTIEIHEDDTWTDDDIADLSTFTLQYAATLYSDSESVIS